MLKKYLPDWELHSLIGKELWDFLSDDPTFHNKLLRILQSSAEKILSNNTIIDHIEGCVTRVTNKELLQRYGDGAQGVNSYLEDIF